YLLVFYLLWRKLNYQMPFVEFTLLDIERLRGAIKFLEANANESIELNPRSQLCKQENVLRAESGGSGKLRLNPLSSGTRISVNKAAIAKGINLPICFKRNVPVVLCRFCQSLLRAHSRDSEA